MRKIGTYFLEGLLFIAPIAVTFYILYFIFTFVDGLLQHYLDKWIDKSIPGLGILVIILLLTLIGFIGSTIIARPFKILFNNIMERAPIVKLIYSAISDLLSAFVSKEKKFNKPVLVKVNSISELEKIGFLTQEDLTQIGIKDKVSVYFPHSYNFSGEMFIVPTENIKLLDIPAAEAMKFVVSGGVSKAWE